MTGTQGVFPAGRLARLMTFARWQPPTVTLPSGANVEDAGDSYVVTAAELPGVIGDEVDVELNEGRPPSRWTRRSPSRRRVNCLHKEIHEG